MTELAAAAAAAADLLDAAADRLGSRCERLDIEGQAERAVVRAAADADLITFPRGIDERLDRVRQAAPPGDQGGLGGLARGN